MLAGNEFQSLGRAIVKADEYEEVRWDGIVSIVSWRERVFRLWWEESSKCTNSASALVFHPGGPDSKPAQVVMKCVIDKADVAEDFSREHGVIDLHEEDEWEDQRDVGETSLMDKILEAEQAIGLNLELIIDDDDDDDDDLLQTNFSVLILEDKEVWKAVISTRFKASTNKPK
ncbi:hypothetical protein ANN_18456 [Periplaneta americana]|uniref:Uncharacterized protein n=1 Tax=Periplaneta americana TaxID=6978 RepID=A0ABQ8SNT5_PERAM|nr:hypothetical protein ANN_18456 [Periplaneta americana]